MNMAFKGSNSTQPMKILAKFDYNADRQILENNRTNVKGPSSRLKSLDIYIFLPALNFAMFIPYPSSMYACTALDSACETVDQQNDMIFHEPRNSFDFAIHHYFLTARVQYVTNQATTGYRRY